MIVSEFKRVVLSVLFEFQFNYTRSMIKAEVILVFILAAVFAGPSTAGAAPLKAGVARVNITNLEVGGAVKDSVFARALVLDDGKTRVVIISADVLIIGTFKNGVIVNYFLDTVRYQLQKDLNIDPENVLINASQLHTKRAVCTDIDKRIVSAVKKAWKNRVPVNIGVGVGHEDRIMENRRLRLKNGKEWTIRHANPLPPDEEVAGLGPVDPEIGILRLDRKDGRPLAVVYNFTCHPYQDSWRSIKMGTTADFPGYACKTIENNLGNGVIALFLQGCDGDITTVRYKDVNSPRDSEPLGNMLGLSTLQALNNIRSRSTGEIRIVNETVELPVRRDIPKRIEALMTEQEIFLQSLRTTSLNLKTFIPLHIKYNLSPEYPSYYSHAYLREKMIGSSDWEGLDAENRINLDKYISNIHAMEKLTRIQENLAYLKEWQEKIEATDGKKVKAEVHGLRIGDFVMVTFPGETVVQVGLNIKKMSPHEYTFISGHTNGNIFYAPTVEQYSGEDYEDANTDLAPEWQKIYEDKVMEILKKL